MKLRRGVNTLCTELGVPLAREVCRRVESGGGPSVLASLSLWDRKWEEGKVLWRSNMKAFVCCFVTLLLLLLFFVCLFVLFVCLFV